MSGDALTAEKLLSMYADLEKAQKVHGFVNLIKKARDVEIRFSKFVPAGEVFALQDTKDPGLIYIIHPPGEEEVVRATVDSIRAPVDLLA